MEEAAHRILFEFEFAWSWFLNDAPLWESPDGPLSVFFFVLGLFRIFPIEAVFFFSFFSFMKVICLGAQPVATVSNRYASHSFPTGK